MILAELSGKSPAKKFSLNIHIFFFGNILVKPEIQKFRMCIQEELPEYAPPSPSPSYPDDDDDDDDDEDMGFQIRELRRLLDEAQVLIREQKMRDEMRQSKETQQRMTTRRWVREDRIFHQFVVPSVPTREEIEAEGRLPKTIPLLDNKTTVAFVPRNQLILNVEKFEKLSDTNKFKVALKEIFQNPDLASHVIEQCTLLGDRVMYGNFLKQFV
jgi:hypothetical protein